MRVAFSAENSEAFNRMLAQWAREDLADLRVAREYVTTGSLQFMPTVTEVRNGWALSPVPPPKNP